MGGDVGLAASYESPKIQTVATLVSVAAIVAALGALIQSLMARNSAAQTLSAMLIPPDQYPPTLVEGKRQSEKLTANYPRDPRGHLYRSGALLDARDFDGAVHELKTALAEEDILQNLLPASFKAALQMTLAASLADRAALYQKSGNLELALADYNEIIRIDIYGLKLSPEGRQVILKIRPFYQRGEVYVSKQDYSRAVADFNEAIRLDLSDAAAYSARGRTLFPQRRVRFAIADLRRFCQ